MPHYDYIVRPLTCATDKANSKMYAEEIDTVVGFVVLCYMWTIPWFYFERRIWANNKSPQNETQLIIVPILRNKRVQWYIWDNEFIAQSIGFAAVWDLMKRRIFT